MSLLPFVVVYAGLVTVAFLGMREWVMVVAAPYDGEIK